MSIHSGSAMPAPRFDRGVQMALWIAAALVSVAGGRAEAQSEERIAGQKSPGLALVLSMFVMPGAGQVYNGQWGKAAIMLGGAAVSYGVAVGGVPQCRDSGECGRSSAAFLGMVGFVIWSVIDAPVSAAAINRRLRGRASIEVGPRLELGRDPSVNLSLLRIRF